VTHNYFLAGKNPLRGIHQNSNGQNKIDDDPMYVGHHYTHILHPSPCIKGITSSLHPLKLGVQFRVKCKQKSLQQKYALYCSLWHAATPELLFVSCRFHINAFFVPCTTDERLHKLNAPLAIMYKTAPTAKLIAII